MRVLAFVSAGLVAVILAVVAVGYLLPVKHSASRERTYAASPSTVFAAISTPADLPRWRRGVKSVELLPDEGERPRFREVGSDGAITYVVEELVPERRMVTRISDKSLPFGGSWTYELMPAANGTTLRITEKGEVYNPIFRFMSRFVLGHHRTIDNYMADLDRHLAEHSARAR
jgi:uncharacterized protein YndB with AHSA1/START domain